MNFKEWYETSEIGVWDINLPLFIIDKDNPADEIINELNRLGFRPGNMYRSTNEIKYIEIWYKEFYITFEIYDNILDENNIISTLAELKEIV